MSTANSHQQRVVTDFLARHREMKSRLPGQNESVWLQEIRDGALDRFVKEGIPSSRHEDWRYVNLRPLLKGDFPFVEVDPEASHYRAEEIKGLNISGFDSLKLVFINGQYVPHLSLLDKGKNGFYIGNLARALDDGFPLALKPRLDRLVPEKTHGFNALNSAFLKDGCVIDVPAEYNVDKYIELLFISAGGIEEPGSLPRNLIVLGEGSRCRIIERHVNLGKQASFSNGVTEIYAEAGSRFDLIKLQQENNQAFNINSTFIQQRAESQVNLLTLTLGGQTVRSEVHTRLCEPGANCDIQGLYLGRGKQNIDNFVRVFHDAPDCRSNEYFKGVMDDRSRAVFQGRIVVAQGAQKTDAQQQNRNLLLSRNAEVDTKPQLEIYADDVKCSHGATIGQLAEESIYYLRSRGIGMAEARQLLTFAFANDLMDQVPETALRSYIESLLAARLQVELKS